jgi:hypothetical protein
VPSKRLSAEKLTLELTRNASNSVGGKKLMFARHPMSSAGVRQSLKRSVSVHNNYKLNKKAIQSQE